MFTRKKRHARRAARLFDTHGGGLFAVATLLTSTRSRAERLVVDAIAGHQRRRAVWVRRRHELTDMSGHLHAQWVSTHAPRGPRQPDDTTVRGRLHDLTDQQVGLVALCLFGGFTHARVAELLNLTPDEVAGELQNALVAAAV